MEAKYVYTGGLIAFTGLLLLLKYGLRKKPQARKSSVPGLDKTHPELGNFPDISEAGSISEFLTALHGKYGGIASFWWGKLWVVSISTPELFKQHSRQFDRPPEMMALLEPMFTSEAITYANGPEGQYRHAAYTRCFSPTAMSNYIPVIHANTRELIRKLQNVAKNEHVSLQKHMFPFTIKTVLQGVFGFQDDEEMKKFEHSFGVVWRDLDAQFYGDLLEEGSERMEQFQQECANIRSYMESILQHVKSNPSDDPSNSNFLDVVSTLDISDSERIGDMVNVFGASYHTTALLLTWSLYYMAKHPDVQHKAAQEVAALDDLPAGPEDIKKLVYLRQVVDEAMRCSLMGPHWTARYCDEESKLGGHSIPAGTPVLHALCVGFQDPQRFPDPQRFDPERFSPESRKAMPPFGFEPFGFAGKRRCLGMHFAHTELMILLAGILRHFEVALVPGQEVVRAYALVTAPKDEIWVTFTKKE